MTGRWSEVAAAFAVATAATAVLLGGAFWPVERALVGAGLALVLALAFAVPWREWTPAERALGLLLGWAVVASVTVAHDRLAAREQVVAWAAAAAVWMLCRRAASATPSLRAAALSTALVVAAGVLLDAGLHRTARASAMFDSPNLAAAVLVPLVPMAWCSLRDRRWRFGAAAALVAGVVATGSRAALLAVLASAVVLVLRGARRRLLAVVATAVALAGGAVAVRLAVEPDPLAWHRPAIWGQLAALVADRPLFGTGPGNLADATGPYRLPHPERPVLHEHAIGSAESTVVAVPAALGVAGAVLAAVVVWRFAAEVRRRRRAVPARWWPAAVVGTATMALFHDFLAAEPVLWWWAAVLGSGAPLAEPRASWSRGAWLTSVAGLGIGLLGLVGPDLARLEWRSGPPSVDRMTAATRLEPFLAEPVEWRVRVLVERPGWTWAEAAEAGALADRLTRLRPGGYSAWLWSGRVAARTSVELGAWPETVAAARRSFDRAAALEPHLPWPWLSRARFEWAVAGAAAARPFLERALDAEPRCAPAWLLEARLAIEDGRLNAAAAALEQVEVAAELFASAGGSDYARQVLTVPPHELERLRRRIR